VSAVAQPAPIDLDPLFRAIGHVTFAWGVLEAYLAELLTALMHTPLMMVLVIGQNYEVVRSHIAGVIDVPNVLEQHDMPRERLSADMRQRIRDALAETQSLAERRNRIVHGSWLLEVSTGTEWSNVRPRRHQLLPRADRLTLEAMHQVASDIEIMGDAFTSSGSMSTPGSTAFRSHPASTTDPQTPRPHRRAKTSGHRTHVDPVSGDHGHSAVLCQGRHDRQRPARPPARRRLHVRR